MDLVPGAGLEPARLAAGDFESPTSTNFITRAKLSRYYRAFEYLAQVTFAPEPAVNFISRAAGGIQFRLYNKKRSDLSAVR